MKKQTYIKPAVQVVNIKAATLLSGSVTGTGVSNTEATGDALGRESDFDYE